MTATKPIKVHSVKYNFVMNAILTITNFLFPLITFPYISRVLHASGYGKTSFALSLANYFTMVASLGIPIYGVKACAMVRDDKDKLSKTAHEILFINSIATVISLGIYIMGILMIPRLSQDRTLFWICSMNIIFNLFGVNWLFQAMEKYDYITARSIVFKLISILLMFLLVQKEADYTIYAGITVFASASANIINCIKIRKILIFKRFKNYNIKQHMKPVMYLFIQNISVAVYTNLDTVMLGFMRGDSEAGLYSAAVKVKIILLSIVSSLGSVLLPRMSYYVQNQEKNKFYDLMVKALNAVSFMVFPLSVYFFCEAENTILFLAGDGFRGSILAMEIIMFAVIPNAITGIIGGQILIPLNKEKYVLYSVVLGAVTDFVMNMLLIPQMGAAGAAVGTAAAEFIVLVVQIILGWDILKHTFRNLKLKRYFMLSFIALIPTLAINFFIIDNPFVGLAASAIVYFGVYFIELILVKDEFLCKLINIKDGAV